MVAWLEVSPRLVSGRGGVWFKKKKEKKISDFTQQLNDKRENFENNFNYRIKNQFDKLDIRTLLPPAV